MTQEIKDKLEQAMRKQFTLKASKDKVRRIAYFSGAQTILDNPGEWGLTTKEDVMAKIKLLHDVEDRWRIKNDELKSQLAKYMEALERILQGNCSPTLVAKEALKQQ